MFSVLKAVATNLLAGLAPGLYVRLTRQTGRGSGAEENPRSIADYFLTCREDLLAEADGIVTPPLSDFTGKVVLEYGPGDFPGVALLLVAMGAEKVFCVDHFPMLSLSPRNVEVARLMADALPEPQRARMLGCFLIPGDFGSGFDPRRIEYLVRPNGFSGLDQAVDLVLSRAVLEHVADLPGIFVDMARALKPGAWMIHQVDLRNHGLYRAGALTFLTPSVFMWNLMYSRKGVPNRWRINHYRDILAGLPFAVKRLRATSRASAAEIGAVRSKLAQPFAHLDDEDLAWLGFWLIARKEA